jgi:hypothetical protein
MVRRRSTVRFRNGAPAQRVFSNSSLSADFKIKRLAKQYGCRQHSTGIWNVAKCSGACVPLIWGYPTQYLGAAGYARDPSAARLRCRENGVGMPARRRAHVRWACRSGPVRLAVPPRSRAAYGCASAIARCFRVRLARRSRCPLATASSAGCRCAGTGGATTPSTWPRSPRSATSTATTAPATTRRSRGQDSQRGAARPRLGRAGETGCPHPCPRRVTRRPARPGRRRGKIGNTAGKTG